MNKGLQVISLGLAIGLLLYAVPRLEIGQGFSLPTLFAIVWLSMILLIIAAYLHHLLGVDEETRNELARIRSYKRWRNQQWLEQATRKLFERSRPTR